MVLTRVDKSRRLAIHTVDGELSMNAVLAAMRSLYDDPEFERDFGVVWDLSGNDLAISLREIIYLDRQIVEFANQNRPDGRVAWVPATGFGAGIIKTLYREHPWAQEWQTFTSLDEAIAWASASPG